MSLLIYRLNDSSFDEAEDIRELLENNQIDYYETSSGRWGFSVAAIWLIDEAQLSLARQIINHYQVERVARIRAQYRQLQADGKSETIFDRLRQHTLLFILTLLMIAFIAYFSIKPFLSFVG
jgi:hypothetical protein